MKKASIIFFFLFVLNKTYSQPITYTFTALAGTYNSIASPTAIPEIFWGSDNVLSGTYNIGFSFKFGCTAYTQFRVSADGWLTFNLTGSVSFADAINDLSGYAAMRPGIAPLWDDLDWNNNNFPPQCGYQVSGTTPTRVLTVQWTQADWKAGGAAPGQMSFQIKLYETTYRIEMVYHQETGGLNAPSASIGLAGATIGDFYSVDAALAAATKITNVQNIATKPAEGQIFRWDTPCNAALPIELISFAGENSGAANILKWSTATEKNNLEFTIESSDDGSNFATIENMKGAGDSYSEKNYSFTDEDPLAVITYYRLKQTDVNKTTTYSEIISVEKTKNKQTFKVFPNPASKELNMTNAFNKHYLLTDVSGKILKEGIYLNNAIDVSDLDNGFYFLKLDDASLLKTIIQHED